MIACDFLVFTFQRTAHCVVPLSLHPFLHHLLSAVVSCLMWWLCVLAMPCVCRGPQLVGEMLLSHGTSVKHVFYRKIQCHWKCKCFAEEKHLHVHHWESGWSRINYYSIVMTLWCCQAWICSSVANSDQGCTGPKFPPFFKPLKKKIKKKRWTAHGAGNFNNNKKILQPT